MLNAFKAWGPSYQLILKDKVSLFLVLMPIAIGIVLYFTLGHLLFSSAITYGQSLIESYISNNTFGQIVYYIAATVLTIALYFIVNWTFVLILSILASPFNDILSKRIEKQYLGESLPSLSDSFKGVKINVIFNEIKKVSFILLLSIFAIIIGYIPILAPVSVFVTVLLLATGYVDYSWSRHDMPFSECKKDMRKSLFSYALGGGVFTIIVSIPLLNIVVPSLATSYFTILWIMNNEHRHKITK